MPGWGNLTMAYSGARLGLDLGRKAQNRSLVLSRLLSAGVSPTGLEVLQGTELNIGGPLRGSSQGTGCLLSHNEGAYVCMCV